MKRILLLFYEPYKSGISRHVKYILDALSTENFDFWLLYSSNDPKILSFFQNNIPKAHIVTVPPHRFFSLKGLLAARKIIHQEKIDSVHIHNFQSILWGYGGSIMARCPNIIFTPHVDAEFTGRSQWFFRQLLRLLGFFTSTLVALTQTQCEWFIHNRIVRKDKVAVINNHISENELHAPMASLRRQGTVSKADTFNSVARNRFVVAQIGRLNKQKNPFFLLKVARIIRNEHPEILFLLAGEGPLRKKLTHAISLYNLQDTFVLAGHHNNIADIFRVSDVISLTSRWEGMPYVLLEACCFKKPVIATKIPGNQSVVINGENGFLVSSEEDFSQKLLTLFKSQDLRHQMGEAGYKINAHLFDIKNMKDSLRTLYGM